jgi:hypothetical protein
MTTPGHEDVRPRPDGADAALLTGRPARPRRRLPSLRPLAELGRRAWSWLGPQLRAPMPVPRPRPGLLAALRRDKLLLWGTVVMSLAALAPLAVPTFLPFGDLPDTAACAALVPEILWGKGLPHEMYSVKWAPVPYWTTTVMIAVFAQITNLVVATKILVGLIALLLPLATMRMLLALGRDPRLGLLAFAFSCEHNMYAGFVAYLLGMGMALWALAWLIEAETAPQALRVGVVGGLIGLTHAQPTLYFVLAVLALTVARLRPRPLRRIWLHALAGAGLVLVFVPWLFKVSSGNGGAGAIVSSLMIVDDPLHERLRDVWRFTFDNFARRGDVHAAARTLAMLLAAPLLLTLLPSRPGASRAAPLALFLAIAALYLRTPMSLGGPVSQWYVYPRFASFLVLSLLFIPRPDLRGARAAWLLPGMAIVLALDFHIAAQFHDWDKRTGPFKQIIAAVPKNSRVLPLEVEDHDPAIKQDVLNQMHAYVAGMRSSYSPHMWRNPALPFQYRRDKDLPQTGSVGGAKDFKLETYGPHYDYVLVQGKKDDPVARQLQSETFRAEVVRETEMYRLYAIKRRDGKKR